MDKPRSASEIRASFQQFFAERGHTLVPPSPVIPQADPTLMFTNAGMNQFKDVFLGTASRDYRRAANSQKVIRAGGKHNDLEDVGRDTYHHTFFEMLGSWSFGDYFKEDAIRWAWELLNGVYGIPKERLHVTYFAGDQVDGLEPDLEARDLWARVTEIDPSHIHPFGKKENFWEMAETGPCGPCSEIHVDLTPDLSGGPLVNADDPRVFEVWNLVFIQFNRDKDKKLTRLPACHVDTGMGFERLVTVLQGKKSNYDTDVFSPLLEAIHQITGAAPYAGSLPAAEPSQDQLRDVAYRVVADHVRTLSFAIADGALPDRAGRGSVLRRILRRGYRYGRQFLGADGPFIHRLVAPLVEQMGAEYPELRQHQKKIEQTLLEEEAAFERTLLTGLGYFNAATAELPPHGEVAAETAFKLHATYGFPFDLTCLIARERGLAVDEAAYETLMEKDRALARASRVAGQSAALDLVHAVARNEASFFAAYPTDDGAKFSATTGSSEILGFCDRQGQFSTAPLEHQELVAVLTRATPFYAEQGGQIGDSGWISQPAGTFRVEDCQRVRDTVLHLGRLESGRLAPGEARLEVEESRREAIRANHTATHLLNLALRNHLGDHVMQKGSLVDAERTRFDFSHKGGLSPREIAAIEGTVLAAIQAELPVYDLEVEQRRALEIEGLRAVFGEKYPERVRVVAIGKSIEDLLATPKGDWRDISIELCGGIHVDQAGKLGDFALVADEGIAAGVRRVVGVTGEAAADARATARSLEERLQRLSEGDAETRQKGLSEWMRDLPEQVLPLLDRQRCLGLLENLQNELKKAQKEQAKEQGAEILDRAAALLETGHTVGASQIFVADLPHATADQLRLAADWLRQKAGSAAVILFASGGEKVALLTALTSDLQAKGLDARQLLKEAGSWVAGGGGGRPDLAQGGGKDATRLPEAIPALQAGLAQKLTA